MNRRALFQGFGASATALMLFPSARAAQTPAASPAHQSPEDEPVDTRARELVARLHDLRPLAVLEALEMAPVSEPILLDAAEGAAPSPLAWNDPGDTDLENALGGVLIVTNDAPLNSPDLETLGGYIVFESAEIAYDQFARQFEGAEASMMSTSVAGTKAWIVQSDDMQLAVLRLGYVLMMAKMSDAPGNVAEGIIMHLDAVTRGMMD